MAGSEIFDKNVLRYEDWFDRHTEAYKAELRAVRELLPVGATSISVGVGTGRFAGPLHIKYGIDPSRKMAAIAVSRGVKTAIGIAESLPFLKGTMDSIIMITTICFVDDPARSIREAFRVLRPGGSILVGIVDLDTPLGKRYEVSSKSSVFYRKATFFSASQIIDLLDQAGFGKIECVQTLFKPLDEITEDEELLTGHGKGAFVVICGRKC